MPRRFFGTGGSLCDTGLLVISLHFTARANALDATPAMLRTVFGRARGLGALLLACCI
jgi:hypothetical protein